MSEIFFNEKLEINFCKGNDGKWEAEDDEFIEKNCRYHKLLFEFNVVMKNEFLNEKKVWRNFKFILNEKRNIYWLGWVFDFCLKDNLFLEKQIVNMFEFEEFQNVLYEFYKETITWLIESFDEKRK